MIERSEVFGFAGFWGLRVGFLANCGWDSLESKVVIPSPEDEAEGVAMRPKERRETGEQDLFRSRLDQIIDLDHALVKLARAIDWRFWSESSARSTPTSRGIRRCRRG